MSVADKIANTCFQLARTGRQKPLAIISECNLPEVTQNAGQRIAVQSARSRFACRLNRRPNLLQGQRRKNRWLFAQQLSSRRICPIGASNYQSARLGRQRQTGGTSLGQQAQAVHSL